MARDGVRSSTNTLHKAAHYRDTAARLRDMAEGEPIERLRTLLSDLADQHEELAEMFRAR
jgi:dihydroneopterin aldolase